MSAGTPAMPSADLKHALDVGPGIEAESWRLDVPAKRGCYLLSDEADTPILLGTAGNLRQVLVGRLGARQVDAEPTRQVDYRAVVRRVRYRPAFSRFEADWSYIENVNRHFARQADRLTRKWRCHWVRIDLAEPFPHFQAVQATRRGGEHFGPLPTAGAARKVVEVLQDLFDLCRYHDVLTQTPHGQACAYKEMGRCPAPCDGSVPFERYREQLTGARALLADGVRTWIHSMRRRMAAASTALAFEEAGRCKQAIDAAAAIAGERFSHLRPLVAHRYLLLHPGSRKHHARAFLARPDGVRFLGEIMRRQREPQTQWLCEQVGPLLEAGLGAEAAGAGLMGWYLLRDQTETGIWLPAAEATDPAKVTEAIERINSTGPEDTSEEADSSTDQAGDDCDPGADEPTDQAVG